MKHLITLDWWRILKTAAKWSLILGTIFVVVAQLIFISEILLGIYDELFYTNELLHNILPMEVSHPIWEN